MSAINYSQHTLKNYFTAEQQKAPPHLDKRLHGLIFNIRLRTKQPKDIGTVRLVFSIINKVSNNAQFLGAANQFLATLLDRSSATIDKHLGMVLEICANAAPLFFTYVTTNKIQYYSTQDLIGMTESFYKVYAKTGKFPLSHLPPYDQGGKDIVEQLLNGSYQNIQVQAKPAPTPLTVQTPKTPNDILDHGVDFQGMVSQTIQYLASLSDDKRATMDKYSLLFKLLKEERDRGHIQDEDYDEEPLGNNELIAIIKLAVATTSRAHSPIPCKYSTHDFHELFQEARTFCRNYGGEELVSLSLSEDFKKEILLDDLIRILKWFNLNAADLDFNMNDLMEALSDKSERAELLAELEEEIAGKKIDVTEQSDIKNLLARFKSEVAFPLSKENLDLIEIQYQTIQHYCLIWSQWRINELVNKAGEIRDRAKLAPITHDEVLQLIAIGRLAIRIKFSIYPYNTQILALLGLLLFPQGAIGQIHTGEGKSTIVTLLAFVLRIQNNRVHIFSSSQALAIRDEAKATHFFKTFDIRTSTICAHNPPAKCFQGDIVYGTVTDFEFGILREMIDFENLFPEQFNRSNSSGRFDVAIIDEVDNLTIDTAMHGARTTIPAEVSYDWVYHPIFQFVNTHLTTESVDPYSDAIINQLRSHLQSYKGGEFSSPASQISNNQLSKWIGSALVAILKKEEKKSYVVLQEKNLLGRLVDKIVIYDAENTGKCMKGMRWSNGLHEFLEIKHGISPQQESLLPLTLTNTVFYQMYRSCFGLTGTLGSAHERETIKEVYGMDSFDVPPHQPSQRKDEAAKILLTKQEQYQAVVDSLKRCQKKGRPALIICKDIAASEIYASVLREASLPFELFNEMQKKSEEEIIEKAGAPKAITIATNNAGRGTDIKPDKQSLKKGGLHVILTFGADSERVEFQARGRAGRQGECGSSEMILSFEQIKGFRFEINPSRPFELPQILPIIRLEKGLLLKERCSGFAKLDRFIFNLASDFYNKLELFHQYGEDEKFLNALAVPLSNRVVNNQGQSFEHLFFKDSQIAKDAFKLIIDRSGSVNQWTMVLKQAIDRITNKMVTFWSVHFYQPAKELIEEKQEPNDSLLNAIEDLYKEQEKVWNNYLDPSGNGLMYYLREVTGLSLTNIGSSNHRPAPQVIQQPMVQNVQIQQAASQSSCHPKGLINLGTSCYINASLQVLRRLEPIGQRIESLLEQQNDHKIAKALLPLLDEGKREDLETLRDTLFATDLYKETLYKSYVKEHGDASFDAFKMSQRDPGEALQAIFEELGWYPLTMQEFASADTQHSPLAKAEQENILSILIPSQEAFEFQHTLTLQEVCDTHFAGVEMEEPRNINGKKFSAWRKQPRIIGKAPDHLILQLARFLEQDKVQTAIEFPIGEDSLKIRCSGIDESYEVVGVINHHGDRINEGHYVAYTKDREEGQWYAYNDTHVTPKAPEEVFSENNPYTDTIRNAYIVVLERKSPK